MRLAERRGLLTGPALSAVQLAALDILYFLDGLASRQRREDMVLAAAVSYGTLSAVQAWPEFFDLDEGDEGTFPGSGTDSAGFTLERATPESFAADMAALVESSRRVVLREDQAPPPGVPPAPGDLRHEYVPDAEWT